MINEKLEKFQKEVLELIHSESSNLEKSRSGMKLCQSYLHYLKHHTESQLSGIPQEIRYFKNEKPAVMSYYILFQKVMLCESAMSGLSQEKKTKLLELEMDKLESFFKRNSDFVKYMEGGHTYLDCLFFTVNSYHFLPFTQLEVYVHQFHSPVPMSMLWAKIKAMHRYAHYLKKELGDKGSRQKAGKFPSSQPLLWTAPKSALTDLIFKLFSTGSVSYGKVALKDLVASFEELFHVRLDSLEQELLETKDKNRPKDGVFKLLRQTAEPADPEEPVSP